MDKLYGADTWWVFRWRIITPTEPTWVAILTHAWENSKWSTCPTMADTPLLHLWTAPEQMTYVSNWLWDTVWKTTPPRERTPIFSLNHLDKHWMKCFQKHSKSVKISVYHLYITCISLVYHVYITTSKQRKLSSIYEYSDNFLSFQYIKKSPGNSTFPGLLNILYYLRNS